MSSKRVDHPPDKEDQRKKDLAVCLSSLGLAPAELSRAFNAILTVMEEKKEEAELAKPPGEEQQVEGVAAAMADQPARLSTEVEASWLLLQRAMMTESDQRVVRLRQWLDDWAMRLALCGRKDIGPAKDVVLRAIYQLTVTSAARRDELAALDEAAQALLKHLASLKTEEELDACSFITSFVASYLQGCAGGDDEEEEEAEATTTSQQDDQNGKRRRRKGPLTTPVPLAVMTGALQVIRAHPSASLRQEVICTVLPAMAPFLSVLPPSPDDDTAAPQASPEYIMMREELWSLIQRMHEEPEDRKEMWAILCVLFDSLMEPLQLAAKVEFWQLLEQGLRSSCPLSRKRALHVLGRYLQSKTTLSSNANTEGKRSRKSSLGRAAPGIHVVQWWQDFLMAVHTLETEHESHLIEQIWPVVIKIVGQVTSAVPVETRVASLMPLSTGDADTWYLPSPSWPWAEVALRGPLTASCLSLKKRYLGRMVKVQDDAVEGAVPVHRHLYLMSEDFVVQVVCVLCMEAHQNRNGLSKDMTEGAGTLLARYIMQLPDDARRESFLIRLLSFCTDRRWGTHGLVTTLGCLLAPCLGDVEYACLGTDGVLACRAFLACRLVGTNSHVQRSLLAMVTAMLRRFTDYRQARRAMSYQAVSLLLADIPVDALVGESFQALHQWLQRLQQESPSNPAWLLEATKAKTLHYIMGGDDYRSNEHTTAENGHPPSSWSSSSSHVPHQSSSGGVIEDDPQARQLAAICIFFTDPSDLRLILGPSVLSPLSKAQSHPYLPVRQKLHALLLLHHICLLALSPSHQQPPPQEGARPGPALTHVLSPVVQDIMAFVTATVLQHLQGLLVADGSGAGVVLSDEIALQLGERSLYINVMGDILRMVRETNRAVSDAALDVLDRACNTLFDMNERQQLKGGGGDQVLARVQAATIIDRVLWNCPASLYDSLASRRPGLQCAMLGLKRGDAITEDFVPNLAGMRSSGVVVQMYSDRLWRVLALLKQIQAAAAAAPPLPSPPPDKFTNGHHHHGLEGVETDEEADVVVPMLCNSLDTTSRRSITDLLSYLCRVLVPYVLEPLRRHQQQSDASAAAEEEVLSRFEAMSEVTWRIAKETAFRPLVCVLVINTLFSPRLMAVDCLSKTPDAPLRTLFQRFVETGNEQKHHIIINLVARCITVWEEDPRSCVHYAKEVSDILVFKEEELDMSQLPDATEEEKRLKVTVYTLPHPVLRLSLLYFLTRLQARVKDLQQQQGGAVSASMLQEFLDEVMIHLLERDMQAVENNSWTPHTHACSKKLRAWQALCLLAPSLHEGLLPRVNKFLWPILARFAVLHVRYHVEVFTAYAVQRFPDVMWPLLLHELRNFNLKPQGITSKLCIVCWAVFSKGAPPLPPSLQDQLLSAALPWLGSTHGYCRILTQLLTYRLLPPVLERQQQATTSSGSADLQYLRSVMAYLTQHREIVRMRAREIPGFAEYSIAERCTYENLLTHGYNESKEICPLHLLELLRQSMRDLHRELQAEDIVGGFSPETVNYEDEHDGSAAAVAPPPPSEVVSLQRKIITSDLLGLASQEQRLINNMNARGNVKHSVIMCASLVDKLPNLAGLARTCEIFAASKLIIPNTKIIELELFQQISSAAAGHVVIEEVKERDTGEFLRKCKSEGYTIVGLEQTSTSQPLQSVKLPLRCVLLLGHEKEGVPVDLLQEVDVLVEIPQLGITRSLNVHVSGALLLWEYTRQHHTGLLT